MRILVLTLLVVCCYSCTPEKTDSTFEAFEVKRGTNIAHWLSQSSRRGSAREEFFTKQDVNVIAEMGFDHIRLPIDEEQMWDEAGNRYEDAFQLLVNCIEWCAEENLRVIVDLHILRSHHFNAKEKPLWTDPNEQEKFFDLWRDLSKTLKDYPNGQVAYELMNEAVADDHESWNQLLVRAFAAIRELEPERTIVIGSNRWQSVNTFDALKVPENDSNILLSFHFYEPFLLTHYTASWTNLRDYSGPVNYPGVILSKEEFDVVPDSVKPVLEKWVGEPFNKSVLKAMWKKPLDKAKALGLPLYCGEFGIMATAPDSTRLNWYTDMVSLFEEHNIGYANWNYASDNFGLTDKGVRNESFIEVVSGKSK